MVSLKKYFFLFLLIFISAFALKALWGPNFYTSHDGQSHLARLYQFDKLLKDGQLPPRWVAQFAGERGYPVFVFAYPLPYLIGELFYILGFNLAESIKLVFALFYLISGISIYLLIKEILKKDWPAFVAAVVFTWAPYRFVKIFVTASLGESMAFAFIPAILLFIYRYIKKPSRGSFIGLALSLAALILTHLISLIIFTPLFLSFTFWCLYQNKDWKQKLKGLTLAGLSGLGLSAFYLIPAIYEIRYTRYSQVLQKQYFKQFVEPIKLLYSRWGYGVPKVTADELSLQVGIAQWLAIGLSIVCLIYLFLKNKKKLSKNFWLGAIFIGNFLLAIFLMLSISKPIWDLLPPLQSVDTPWRFLSLTVLSSAFLAGWLLSSLKNKKIIIFSLAILLFLAGWGNRNHLRINASVDWDEQYFQNYYWVGSGWDEYRTRWIKDTYHKPPKRYVEILSGECKIKNLKRKSNKISFNLDCQNKAEVLVHHAYYPGWMIRANGEEKTGEVIGSLEKSQGLMNFKVKEGSSQIKLNFKESGLRIISDLISLTSIIFLIVLISSGKKKLLY